VVTGLRVAIDLDGTLADLSAAMYAVAARELPGLAATMEADPGPLDDPDMPLEQPSLQQLALSSSQLDELWGRVLKIRNFWTTLEEMEEGAVAYLAAIAAERRWEVLFVTTRPPAAGETTQVQSQHWLEAHGFPRPSVYVVKGSRGKIAEALQLDAVIDDRPENCLDVVVESTARAILVWPESPDSLPPGAIRHSVTVVPTITAALDTLLQFDRARTGGVGRSIRRLFSRG
jgi:hypothetical protein